MMKPGPPLFLVDTNLFIYAYDAAEIEKRARAIEVVRVIGLAMTGAISVQILGEFFTNVTRKPLVPLTLDQARDTSIRMSRSWRVLDVSLRTHLDAVRGVAQYQLSYWDALVWATARQSNVPSIVTEDQEHGRLIEDIRYINPFAINFDMALLR